METMIASWGALLLLGGLHGVNPGMGWLFAVALGLQEGNGRAVWRALPPLLTGHMAAVGAAVAAGGLLGIVISPDGLRLSVAAALIGLGVLKLRRQSHPRYGGMRVTARQLAVWSFLMASVHGAGLMALPFIPGAGSDSAPHMHAHPGAMIGDGAALASAAHATQPAGGATSDVAGSDRAPYEAVLRGLVATGVHTLGYLLLTGLIAAIVYYRLGLRRLQQLWLNIDQVWALALVATGTLVILT